MVDFYFVPIVMFPPGSCPHIEGVADAGQASLSDRKDKAVSILFVRGRPVLQILHDSGLAPQSNIALLRTRLRSCRTMFTESKKKTLMLRFGSGVGAVVPVEAASLTRGPLLQVWGAYGSDLGAARRRLH